MKPQGSAADMLRAGREARPALIHGGWPAAGPCGVSARIAPTMIITERDPRMFSVIREFFGAQYAPHGYCLLWEPWLIWSHVVSDALIAIAYFSIPVALVIFIRRRRDVSFGFVFWLFALFITACGITHVMRIWNMWHGEYGLEAVIKVLTAAVSIGTAIALWPLLPRVLALPSPGQLREVNEALRYEIAERRKAEAALLQAQKMEAVGRLSGGIAHDFHNILQVVGGSLSLIADQAGAKDAKIKGLTDSALLSIDRGIRITGQLLSFSQEQGATLDAVRVPDLLIDLEELLGPILPERVRLEIEASDAPPAVLADPSQLEIAILNLAINAREAMPNGGTLRIALSPYHATGRHDLADGEYVRISVTDTGIGMAADVAQRALEPFFSTKPAGMGSGLGLSMVYGMSRSSGGTTTVESRLGVGTTISIYLRLAGDEIAGVPLFDGEAGRIDEDLLARLTGTTILLVDDEAPTRSVVAMTLESLGCVVTQAESGLEAIRLADEDWPETFVLDFAMPGMNGAEVAAAMRAKRPDARIVFLTGFADMTAIRDVAGTGAVVLHKPATRAQLARALGKAMAQIA
jgi:signal transduction histidine kinase/ActR/RegA family two-component response regulator